MYSPVSMTPAKNVTGVIDTGQKISPFSPVSMTPAKHVFTGVNDSGNACIAGVVDTVDAPVGPLAVRQCL
jgi:hypothetical protein